MQLTDLLEDEKNVYYVFENCGGTTLFEHIMNSGNMKEEAVSTVASSVLSIYKYLHS